jgi:dienelactone hydrolase
VTLRWTEEPIAEHGVLDRGFELDLEERRVPGVLLTPDDDDRRPQALVLIGHGRTLHKRHRAPYSVARRLVRREGVSAALLDQPGHGDRPPAEDDHTHAERRAMASADWLAALDRLSALPAVDGERVGYWGLSLGTDYGLPFVAGEPRVSVAVLGLYGTHSTRIGDTESLGIAATVDCPLLWVMQWDDEQFDRGGQLDLFDAIGSDDKRMVVYPGGHDETPDEGLRLAREFLVRELGVGASSALVAMNSTPIVTAAAVITATPPRNAQGRIGPSGSVSPDRIAAIPPYQVRSRISRFILR